MNNRILCVYHSRDLDGWMSAAIIKKYFIDLKEPLSIRNADRNEGWVEFNVPSREEKEISESDINRLVFLGWDYGDEIPNLSAYNKVIIVDISFPKDIMWKLRSNLDKDFIWIDHHSSAIKESIPSDHKQFVFEGLQNSNAAACELTWMYFNSKHVTNYTLDWEGMPEIVRLLGRYDCFGHKGTSEEQKVLEFQYGARQVISNYEEAYQYLITRNPVVVLESVEKIHNKGIVIYKYLCTEAKQTYAKSFPIEFTESRLTIWSNGNVGIGCTTPSQRLEIVDGKSKVVNLTTLVNTDDGTETEVIDDSIRYKFLAVNQERFNPINFGIDYHKEAYDGYACFWYNKGKWNWSLYNDNGEVDCSVIAKQYGGGGHPGASGFVLNDEDQNVLIKINKR